ncbi:MAG: MOSC domain-containing protein [Actinomycetota bacterium]|nr:MOSC domain-containing protein [Actinomycetota bacterium]
MTPPAGESPNRPEGGLVLSQVYVYPIKSCGGIALKSAALSATGLRYDRRWMLVDETGEFLSQRKLPRMALISVRFGPGALIVGAPGMPYLELPLHPPEPLGLLEVDVWGDKVRGAPTGEEADRWFGQFLGFACRLVYMPDEEVRSVDSAHAADGDQFSLADAFPFLLISEASLDDLNGRMEEPVAMNRFRPNLVVRGCEPYAEDGWSWVRIGGVSFRVAEPCARCAVTTVNQESGARGKEPLRTLATYRKVGGEVFFGRNLIHGSLGTVRVGDPAEVTPRRSP